MGKFRACGLVLAVAMLAAFSMAYAEEAAVGKAAPKQDGPALRPSDMMGGTCPMGMKGGADAATGCALCPLGSDCPGAGMCDVCPMGKTAGKSPGDWLLGMKEKLALTDKQVEHLKAMGAKFDERIAERRATIKMKIGELRKLMANENADVMALKGKLLEIASDKIETVVSFVEAKQKAVAELTAGQNQKLGLLLNEKIRNPADPARMKPAEIP